MYKISETLNKYGSSSTNLLVCPLSLPYGRIQKMSGLDPTTVISPVQKSGGTLLAISPFHCAPIPCDFLSMLALSALA